MSVTRAPFHLILSAGSTGQIDGLVNLATAINTDLNCAGDLTIAPASYINGNGNFILSSGGILRIGSSNGITKSAISGNIQVTGSRTYTSGANYEYNGTAAQVTGNGLTQNTPANLTINNSNGVTLSGVTTISGLLAITSGILNISGNNLTAGSLTGSGGITASGGTRTLTIGSDGTTPAAYSGKIDNGTATSVAVIKTGSGTMTLSGVNSYTGTTTISGGVLQLGAADPISNSSNIILNGGSLRSGAVSGYSETLGTLTLTGNSVIALGTGSHSLTFAPSSSQSWTTGKILTITGWRGTWDGTSGTEGKVFAGSAISGLTADQVGQIRFENEYGASFPANILSTGELVPNTTGNITVTYNSSSTFTAPACVTSVTVGAWGGGGKGSTLTAIGKGGGGGGGAYSAGNVTVIPGNTYTVTVGTGSTGTGPGGDSWFGSISTIMAKGGSSVLNNIITGATGGLASACIGTTKYSGGNGANAASNYGGGGGSSAGTGANGNTGSTYIGGIAPAGGGNGGNGRSGTSGSGSIGFVPGGGGGGAFKSNLYTPCTGGAGANGKVIVIYTATVPTIIPGSNPVVCLGTATADLPYSNPTGCPDQYSIDYDAAANAAGFTDVVNGSLGVSPIVLTIPAGAEAATYNGILTVKNSASGLGSNGYAIGVTLNGPQGSLAGNAICTGGTGQFTFTSTSGTGPFTLTIDGQNYSGVTSGTPFNANPNPAVTTNYTLTSITDAADGCVRTSGIAGASATITVAYQWTGAIDSDWGKTGNWSCNFIPTSLTNTLIPSDAANMPVITSPDAVCNNLIIEGTLTIGSGGMLTAAMITSAGTFTIDPSGKATISTLVNNGTLNLNSNSPSGIFSLMMDSYSGSGTANVQLFLTGGGYSGNFNWHLVAVPVDGLSKTYFTDINAYNLMAYNDSRVVTSDKNGWSWHDGYGGNPDIPAGGGFSTLSYGHGYNFYSETDATVNFTGMPSLGTTLGTASLQYSGSTPNNPIYGLNLLGNSITCSIDWNNVMLSGPVSSTVYYVIAQKWSSYNVLVGGTNGATKDIPPLQGFFVQATGTGASIDLTAAKEHSGQPRYKKSGMAQDTGNEGKNPPKLKLELTGTKGTSDETIVWFNNDATQGFDNKYDGYKIFYSGDRSGQLFSIMGGKSYVINGIPLPDDYSIVPLGIKISQAGNYSLVEKDFLAPEGYDIWLADKYNNNLAVNLKNTLQYSFYSDTGTFSDRFFLRISSLSSGTKYQELSYKQFNIYGSDGMINIVPLNSTEDFPEGEVKVFDLMGRIVKQVANIEWNAGTIVQIPLNDQHGIYIVEVTSGVIKQVGKVFLE